MTDSEAKILADRIVADIFRNGAGERAERLVLLSKEGRDLGGWGALPLADRIVRLLQQRVRNPKRHTTKVTP